MPITVPPGPDDRLDSWKEIAAHLKRGVRTVQRWERVGGLPVHRLDPQGSVFAYKAELDAWWAGSQQTNAPAEGQERSSAAPSPRFRWIGAATLSVVLVAVTGVAVARWVVVRSSDFKVLDPVPLTSDLGSESDPTFSPDGNQVAYAWDGPSQNQWDIYVKMVGSDSPVRLTKGPA
jgi:WD40-like Beta Propeller Repeat